MFDFNKLPDIMYFGASKQMSMLKNRVFLTPHIGIASLFIINIDDLFNSFPKGYKTSCNISYRQWDWPNDILAEPLATVNVTHNIAAFASESSKGKSSGYIHAVDVSSVKDRLSLFTTNNPDREVVYNGDEPLIIIKCISHTVRWDFNFCSDNVMKHGIGVAEKT